MGDWKVILTPQSLDDLREIVSFIARDNPERANSFGNALIDKALSIRVHFQKGRIVPELNDPAVREVIHGAYRVVYEVRSVQLTVFVLRFWHGARGTPEFLHPD